MVTQRALAPASRHPLSSVILIYSASEDKCGIEGTNLKRYNHVPLNEFLNVSIGNGGH